MQAQLQEQIDLLRKKEKELVDELQELQEKKAKEDQEAFMATFKEDRSGNIITIRKARYSPLIDETTVSIKALSQLTVVDLRINEPNQQVLKAAF
jgi:hypothetical protein